MSGNTYEDAIRLLTSRSKAFRKVVRLADGRPRAPIPNHVGMREWLALLGHDESEQPFDVIHVTGTKGKGGTCAWTDALLRAHFRAPQPQHPSTSTTSTSPSTPDGDERHNDYGAIAATHNPRPKVGLYTSPHIVTERERIRIDFKPVSEAAFARHFFQVWDTILANVGGDVDRMPGYLQLLALLSAHVFRMEGVSVAIYEVHAGGRFCSTNMWGAAAVVACGFNTIGLDHIGLLGNNIKEIAWNKAGIMKKGARAFSVHQVPDARGSLVAEAEALGCPLVFIDEQDDDEQVAIPTDAARRRPELLLPGPRSNLRLAAYLANAYLQDRKGEKLSEEEVLDAVRDYNWPGRFQVVEPLDDSTARWYLDFAHNDLSLPVALDWFGAEVARFDEEEEGRRGAEPTDGAPLDGCPHPRRRRTRVLVFGHQSHHRETAGMAEVVSKHCRESGLAFDHVILSGHSRRVSGRQVFDYEEARKVIEVWKGSGGWSPEVAVTWSATIKEAMEMVEQLAARDNGQAGAHALIVGSSHLVSSAVAAMPGSTLPGV